MEEYFFDLQERSDDRVYVLIIYDIVENKKRVSLAKFLQGYGFRIQKSAFEAKIKVSVFQKLLREIPQYASQKDSIRIYKIIGKGQIYTFGNQKEEEDNEIIII